MTKTTLASMALFAARALAVGQAIVVNNCDYDVWMANTPSAGGGYNTIYQTLSAGGGSYSQTYTQLSNGNGWSIKLSLSAVFINIMQYEYTYQGPPTLWFDLSDVNGNPWDNNWEITATGDCSPRMAAYRFSTDDAYGMQTCPVDSSITVTLCSGSSGGAPKHHHHHHHHHHKKPSPTVSSPQESVAPTTTYAPATTSEAPVTTSEATAATTTTAVNTWGGQTWGGGPPEEEDLEEAGDKATKKKLGGKGHKTPTTLATSSSPDGSAVTVTNMKLETVVKYVTATAKPTKRHVHHPHQR